MAVNDKELTERVRKAAEYFGKIVGNHKLGAIAADLERNIPIDGEMLEIAAYAVSVRQSPEIIHELQSSGDVNELANWIGAPDAIVGACDRYAMGFQKISMYEARCAMHLCSLLSNYVGMKEKV